MEEVTPKAMRCIIGSCPQIHQTEESYFVVGEKVDPAEVGLSGKVGESEVLIKVPKKLIDDKE